MNSFFISGNYISTVTKISITHTGNNAVVRSSYCESGCNFQIPFVDGTIVLEKNVTRNNTVYIDSIENSAIDTVTYENHEYAISDFVLISTIDVTGNKVAHVLG